MFGAGRFRVANALEDLDWYVVDNLPPQLLPALAGMMTSVGAGVHRLAAVVDVRSRALAGGEGTPEGMNDDSCYTKFSCLVFEGPIRLRSGLKGERAVDRKSVV